MYASKHVDTDDAQIDGDISPVVARVGGYVKDINFEENTKVSLDQVLVRLDDRDYKIKLEQAQAGQVGANAGVGVSKAQIAATSANTSTAKANIEAAKSNVQAANVKLNLAQKDFDRYANLIKDGAITQQAFDQAKANKMCIRDSNKTIKMIKNKFKLLLSILLLPTILHAQSVKKLTLQEAIDLGIANSKNLKLSQNKIDEAVARLAVVKDNVLPNASASFLYNHAEIPTNTLTIGGGNPIHLPNRADAFVGTAAIQEVIYGGVKYRYCLLYTSRCV